VRVVLPRLRPGGHRTAVRLVAIVVVSHDSHLLARYYTPHGY
jgi:hypothetical protein